MKKFLTTIIVGISSFIGLNACASNPGSNTENITEENMGFKTDGKKMVVFFSHAGENYGVGKIEKGNTRIVAEIIADASGADIFEIIPENAYPEDSYDECVEMAKQEKQSNARPAVKGDVKIEDYDVIFLGYPNWWGDLPMCVYTFIDKHNWDGKTIIPFITHEGSGMGGTDKKIADYLKDADVATGRGLAIQGQVVQRDSATTKTLVNKWLKELDIK